MDDFFKTLGDRAWEKIREADEFMGDAIALDSAVKLMTDRLREGHMLSVEAHCRALAKGFSDQWVADYLRILADNYDREIVEREAAGASAAEEAAYVAARLADRRRVHKDLLGGKLKASHDE